MIYDFVPKHRDQQTQNYCDSNESIEHEQTMKGGRKKNGFTHLLSFESTDWLNSSSDASFTKIKTAIFETQQHTVLPESDGKPHTEQQGYRQRPPML